MTDSPTLTELVEGSPEGMRMHRKIADLTSATHASQLEEFIRGVVLPKPLGRGSKIPTARRAVDAIWPLLNHLGDRRLEHLSPDVCRDHMDQQMMLHDHETVADYRMWIHRYLEARLGSRQRADAVCPLGKRAPKATRVDIEFLPQWHEVLTMLRACEGNLEKMARIVVANASLIQPREHAMLDESMFSWDEATGITIIQLPPSRGYPQGRPVVLRWGDEIMAAYIAVLRARGQSLLFPPRSIRGRPPKKYRSSTSMVRWLREHAYECRLRIRGKDRHRRVNVLTCRQALACDTLAQGKGEQGVRQCLGITHHSAFEVYKQAALAHQARQKQDWGTRHDLIQNEYRRDCPVCMHGNAATALECQRPGCRYRFERGQGDRVEILKERVMLDVSQFLEAVGMTYRDLAEQALAQGGGSA